MPYDSEKAQAKQALAEYRGGPTSEMTRSYDLDESQPVMKSKIGDFLRSSPGVASYIRHYSKLIEDDARKEGRQPDDEDFMNALLLAQMRYEQDKRKRKSGRPDDPVRDRYTDKPRTK